MRRVLLKRIPSPLFILVGVLLVLLAILATLQYRWLSRVGAGERELLMKNLRSQAEGFCREFDNEITLAYSTFTINAELFGSDDRDEGYAARYDIWLKTAGRPRTIKDIFLIEAKGGGRFDLLRFNPQERKFESIGWLPELEGLRQRFERQNAASSEKKEIFIGGAESIVEEIPALVSSVAAVKNDGDRREVDWQHPLGYGVITLDLDYIKQEFLPALAGRHFLSAGGGGGNHDYNLSVHSRRDPKNVIYRSISENPKTGDSSIDVRANLLSIGFDQVRTYSTEGIYSSSGKSANREKTSFTLVIPQTKDEETPNNGGGGAGRIRLVNDVARWELRLSHRSGSLEAAITNAQWWNFAASFGILLLLGASVVMIAVLSRRTQRLARRQIDFVAGVSHEFRTPLAVIHSLSENLAAGRIRDSRQIERYGATIRKDVRRLTEMVEQILEFAGAERGGRHFYDKTPIDAGAIVEKVVSSNMAAFEDAGWKVVRQIQPDLPPVAADAAALSRAIQNLLGNALKYGGGDDDNRSLTVEARSNPERQEVVIVVEDNGTGISPADLAHVFEPFYRGREAVAGQIPGNGIGLSLVRQIVEAHDGSVTVESSRRGRGARFTLRLPIVRQAKT